MKLCRWFGALVLLIGFAVVISPNLSALAGGKDKKGEKKETKKDETKKEEAKGAGAGDWTWMAFDPDKSKEFYQTLATETTQKMKVMGMEVTQEQKQTFYIKWTPKQKDKGNWVVTQKIVGVKMDIDIGGNKISHDSTNPVQQQNPMTDFFKALLDLELTFTIDKDLKVINIDGNEEFIKKLSKTNPQMEPLLKSILSKDALMKMTEPTLFAFPTTKEKTWKKESTLSLGPIGSYTTDYSFSLAGKDKDGEKINVKASMVYKKPTEKGKLPFQIDDGELTGKDGTGYAIFNVGKGRFDKYQMKMKLEGNLKIDIGGMKTTVELVQDQNASVTTSDSNPVEAAAPKKK